MASDPWAPIEAEMKAAGYDLDKIPQNMHEEHLWADGLLLWWSKHRRLPTAEELGWDMMEEWDDGTNLEECELVLNLLTS